MYLKNALLIGLMFVLAGCVEAKNVSDAWAKATLDPALEGKWKLHSFLDDKDEIDEAVLEKDKGYYLARKEGADGDISLKTLMINGSSFALFKPLDDSEESVLCLYKLEGDNLTLYDTEEKMEFEKLDDEAMNKIAEAFKDISKLKIIYSGQKVKT